ncbi:RNA-guided endonuclease TnpB family protein [Lactobacillus sp. PV012]|uniref:RNA-guided endonuclease TnpB family protein n=1 Tax=Lactobacillus sp. PV012 TaxID=2594494 RepID=UPI00223F7AB5|nr:RNA-guided endonuclease TnpB family protein [Lactobacillus sp. PV012]QNQ82876.1 IS200/IS605 family element transposase accessory protein TnpB [Lactobacillus sp. PV012]
MLKGIKLKLYPNMVQQEQLDLMFGNDRFVWNQMLAMMNKRYESNKQLPFLGKFKLNYLLKPLKVEYPFLKQSDSSSLQVINEFLTQAWKNFFNDKTGKIGKPKFHSRKYLRQSYTGKSTIKVAAKRYLKLPKLGYIKASKTNLLKNCKIKRYTLSLEPNGKYYIALQVQVPELKQFPKTNQAVGIDVSLANLAILSDGTKYHSFNGSYFEKKAKSWQRKYSKRKYQAQVLVAQDKNRQVLIPRSLESFKNWQKAQKQKAVYQAKIANQRKDYLHKLTTKIVKQYDVIVIEDLKTKNLQKNHKLAKSISNASWRIFRTMLEYKCRWYGKELITVDPRNTSRICYTCKFNSGEKGLEVREWTCPNCHVHHDRDINAAVNILNKGKSKLNGQGLAVVNS